MSDVLIDEHKDTIEDLIDAAGVTPFLATVAAVCAEKAAHVEEAWQDHALSARWSVLAAEIADALVGTEGM